ncbi:hydrocephalus-inducing protein-like [Taeniopygia guttata]|uniref:hydrocephalus-inducing protein-like n=1 Tax=Taeniopygia guttata TaxID=59729 RepID=UPI003BB90DAB
MRGSVTGPTSLSDTIKLNLEDISSGSPNTKTCCLTDTSPVFQDGLWRKNCFPNLQIQPSTLEFVGGTEEVRSLEMTNCSPLLAKYHWSLCSDSQADKLGYKLNPPKFKPQPPKEQRTSRLDCSAYRRRFRIRKEEVDSALKEARDFAQSLGTEVPPQTPGPPHLPLELAGITSSVDAPHTPLEAEEAFSILPLSGVLQPGESQQVSFTFSGRRDILGSVKALCCVEGGPTYEVELISSRLSYSLSCWEINCGPQFHTAKHRRGSSGILLGETCRE